MPDHYCHATGCKTVVPPAMFMCRKHWHRLPRTYRDAIWATYRSGQEVDKRPSREYLMAARAAIRCLERIEEAATHA